MIIPSRWFSGGKGLDSFREEILNDARISQIVDYADSKNCFPSGMDIPGRIYYFLWEQNHTSSCRVTNVSKNGDTHIADRVLNEYTTFIRQNQAVSIVHKVLAFKEETMDKVVSSRKPFGLESSTQSDLSGTVILRNSLGLGKILP